VECFQPTPGNIFLQFETAIFFDFVEFSILLIGRPENASLRRKTRKTIKYLVFDGESNGVGLEKMKKNS
jgi:hypothetical protein